MPAIVGAVNINDQSGVFNIGDVVTIAPKSFFKTFAGGGSFNTGRYLEVRNAPSVIQIQESQIFDQSNLLLANDYPLLEDTLP